MNTRYYCMKFPLILLLVFCLNPSILMAEETRKEAPNLYDLLVALRDQIIRLKETPSDKMAGLKLKECQAEVKYVLRRDVDGKLNAYVVELGGEYEDSEINTLTTVWEPAEPTVMLKQLPEAKYPGDVSAELSALKAELQSLKERISTLERKQGGLMIIPEPPVKKGR